MAPCGGEETFDSLHVFSLLQYRATIRWAVFEIANCNRHEVGWIIRDLYADPIVVVQNGWC
ncbi:MAG: hypothetical protein DMG12_23855 [Acidobacteria bacterium]|nr:MAG: hypothetical protein DMG12_23855 [Acidobacteriota bacterium]